MTSEMSVRADRSDTLSDNAQETSVFRIEAELLASDTDTYNIQVNVKNGGADWEGIVRVSADEEYRVPSVYDTTLSLPKNSEKQFTVKIPKGASDSSDGSVRIMLLDKKNKVVADKTLKRFLSDQMQNLSMGILSDSYDSLTYLDMGGLGLYYYGSNMSVKLVELNKDNFADMLDSLTLLVVDDYNTDVLTEDERKALALWIDNGGVLIVGTGSYAENTLSGLTDILPVLRYDGVVKPEDADNALNLKGDSSVDISKLPLANLVAGSNQYFEGYSSYALMYSPGDGALGILPYSLVELGTTAEQVFGDIEQEQFVLNMLEEISGSANARYNRADYSINIYEQSSMMRRMMGILGNSNSELHFGVLKILVVFYVIFVGPILYLILRFTKKRELYWVMVPVTALAGIVVVFLAGRGFEVVHTKVYSVTTEDLSSKKESKTYLYCYDASYREWSLQLEDDYAYVGPLNNENYNYSDDADPTKYYHRTKIEGGKLSFGIKPSSSFEDSYFLAGKEKEASANAGKLRVEWVTNSWTGFDGVISNETDKDFIYYAVILNDSLSVYEKFPAGEKMTLADCKPIYTNSSSYDIGSDYIYDCIRDVREGHIKGDVAALSALGVGIMEAYPRAGKDSVVVCGVTADYAKAVSSDCNEVSYGCLYVVD